VTVGSWSRLALAAQAVNLSVGLFIGALLTWHHDRERYGVGDGTLIGCEESSEVSCQVVNTSAWSEVLGIPVGTWSFAAHLAVFALIFPAWRGQATARGMMILAGALATLGSGWFYYVSKVELGFVCAWCLRIYGVNFLILVLALLSGRPAWPDLRAVAGTVTAFLGASLLAVGGERLYRAQLLGDETPTLAQPAPAAVEGDDPAGAIPARTLTVTTEDQNTAELRLGPDDAWKGKADAEVVVVEFADLECPYCKRLANEMKRLEATYGDRVLFVFKHFPMDPACNPGVKNRLHPEACLAARFAVCAKEQQKFWRFHDLAFKNQHDLGEAALRAYAQSAGLDADRLNTCLADPASAAAVRADAEAGQALDLHGTPRVFLQGKLYRSGSSAEVMARAIEEALGASAADAAQRAAALREVQAALPPVPEDTPPTRALALGDLRFSIDTFEASLDGDQAVSRRHLVPALRTTWYEAQAACAAAGKRLCTEREWVSACQGAAAIDDDGDGEWADDLIEGTAYPYGDDHQPGRCWDGKEGDAFRPVYTGESPGCVSAGGVYDLTGNVEEWAGTTPETAVLLGGAWDTSKDNARCYRRNHRFGPGYATARTGFRCCGP
jgi:protein-disulfide isomerase/uncharacterized membrane protein